MALNEEQGREFARKTKKVGKKAIEYAGQALNYGGGQILEELKPPLDAWGRKAFAPAIENAKKIGEAAKNVGVFGTGFGKELLGIPAEHGVTGEWTAPAAVAPAVVPAPTPAPAIPAPTPAPAINLKETRGVGIPTKPYGYPEGQKVYTEADLGRTEGGGFFQQPEAIPLTGAGLSPVTSPLLDLRGVPQNTILGHVGQFANALTENANARAQNALMFSLENRAAKAKKALEATGLNQAQIENIQSEIASRKILGEKTIAETEKEKKETGLMAGTKEEALESEIKKKKAGLLDENKRAALAAVPEILRYLSSALQMDPANKELQDEFKFYRDLVKGTFGGEGKPTLEQFLAEAAKAGSKMTAAQLRAYYDKNYGG